MKTLMVVVLTALCATASLAQIRSDYAFANAPLSDAEDLIGLLRNGSYYEASESFDDAAQKAYSPDRLKQMWESQLQRYGRLHDFEAKAADVDGTTWRIHVICTFEKGAVDAVVSFDSLSSDRDPNGLSFDAAPLGGQGPFKVP